MVFFSERCANVSEFWEGKNAQRQVIRQNNRRLFCLHLGDLEDKSYPHCPEMFLVIS